MYSFSNLKKFQTPAVGQFIYNYPKNGIMERNVFFPDIDVDFNKYLIVFEDKEFVVLEKYNSPDINFDKRIALKKEDLSNGFWWKS